MIENEPDILEVTGTPIGTTGRQLRETREARGWDIDSLSESLHLRPAVVMAIEQGHYREVPELFLKGYVRSYARQVGLDGDRMVRQLESELQPLREEEAERRVESPVFHMEVKKRKKRKLAFWVLILAVLAAVVFGIIRFQGMDYGFGLGNGATDQDGGTSAAADSNAGDNNGLEASAIDNAPDNSAPDSGAVDAVEMFRETDPESIELLNEGDRQAETDAASTTPPLNGSAGTAAPAETDSGEAAAGEVEVQVPPGAPGEVDSALPATPRVSETVTPSVPGTQTTPQEGSVESEPASVPAVTAEAGEPLEQRDLVEPQPAVAEQRVPDDQVAFSIEFDGDCWIEIRNGSGERIYAALQSAGDQLSQTAQAPVSFVLGNIDGIASFTFGGESVDIEEYPSRNGRAEVTLIPDSGN